jgi:hypothetical protein
MQPCPLTPGMRQYRVSLRFLSAEVSRVKKNMKIDRLITIAKRQDAASWMFFLGLLPVISFVWMYKEPLGGDLPNHFSNAKAFGELLVGHVPKGYPYQLDVKLSTYAPPEMLVSGLIMLFGVNTAVKLALSLYAAAFALLMYVLVGKIDKESRWTRLVGLPFALSYFFHWGFWPYLIGLLAALLALILSEEFKNRRFALLGDAAARLIVLFCHPLSTLGLGVIDVSLGLHRLFAGERRQLDDWVKTGCRLLVIWLPSVALTVYMAKAGICRKSDLGWMSMGSQLIQLLRSVYLTQYWWEELIPMTMFGILTWEALMHSKKGGIARSYLFAGFVTVIIGILIPRESFLGSYEDGARVVLMGFLLIASSWASIERGKRGLIAAWIMIALCSNIAAGHYVWRKNEPAAVWALNTLKTEFADYSIETRMVKSDISSKNRQPCISAGFSIGNLAWMYGYVKDADNRMVSQGEGPVKYVGTYSTKEKQRSEKKAIIFYHPYSAMPKPPVAAEATYSDIDNVYTIVKLPQHEK